jgi:two-component system, sensor histidine kinase and response regulator
VDKENNLIKVEKESQRLFALAERETNSRKADSLTNLAQKAQLEEQKTEAEAKTQQAIKDKTVAQQQNLLYILAIAIVLGTIILGLIARSRQIQKKANRTLQTQNVEIQQQKEEIQVQSESLHQLNQWKDKIFAVIAHGLRSPLMAMQGVGKPSKLNFIWKGTN